MNWSNDKIVAVSLVSTVSVLVLVYCISYGSAILNIFNPEGQGVLVTQDNYAASRELKSVFAGEDKVSAALRDGNPSLSQPLSPTNPNNNSTSNHPPGGHPIADIHSSSSGTAAERVYFHLLLVMFCCYTAMILTSWGNTDGSPDSTSPTMTSKTTNNSNGMTRAEESMWIKIASQWVFLLLYMKVLHAAYIDNL